MMLKNEEKRLHITLESIKDFADKIIIYDTGSTDNTLNILTSFSSKHNIPVHIRKGEFEDFSKSRNVLMDYIDSFQEIDFVLLLDCNDELKGHSLLRSFAENLDEKDSHTGWLMQQEWFANTTRKYLNVRFIRPNHSWRYSGVVHEWIARKGYENQEITIIPNVVIYQDRSQDDDKSSKRFHNDKIVLLKRLEEEPSDSRSMFYLGQTCLSLGQYEDAWTYFSKRTDMIGFHEEVFQSFLMKGEIALLCIDINNTPFSQKMSWTVARDCLMNAFELSHRIEPLIHMIYYYISKDKMDQAYHFSRMACELKETKDILFVNKDHYDYTRFHLLARCAYWRNYFEEGYEACMKALSVRDNLQDRQNLEFYLRILDPDKMNRISFKRR